VTKKANSKLGRPVLVTTAHRGVFFGYADKTDGETIRLKRARLCVYWTADLRGFMGLASQGPKSGCKIGPAADIELRAITSVVAVSPEAVEKWESAPWS
jgi:hypothetical protein